MSSDAGSVNSIKKEVGSPFDLTDHDDSDSYQSADSPEDRNYGRNQIISNSSSHGSDSARRSQVCASSDEECHSRDSDNEQDVEDSSPWSEIISKYLRGTTKMQMFEYRKLLRPHTCDRSKCKFKRKYSEYRMCKRHNCQMSECYKRPKRRPSESTIPEQTEVPNTNHSALLGPAVVLTATTNDVPISFTPRTPNSATGLSVQSTVNATAMNGLPYPPLYCHDSGLWSTQNQAPLEHFPNGQLRALAPTGFHQQEIPFPVTNQYQVRLSIAQQQQNSAKNQYLAPSVAQASNFVQTQFNPKAMVTSSQFQYAMDSGEPQHKPTTEEALMDALFMRSATPGPSSASSDHISSNSIDAEERYNELVEAEKMRRRALN